jgi:hypothetical protein
MAITARRADKCAGFSAVKCAHAALLLLRL